MQPVEQKRQAEVVFKQLVAQGAHLTAIHKRLVALLLYPLLDHATTTTLHDRSHFLGAENDEFSSQIVL